MHRVLLKQHTAEIECNWCFDDDGVNLHKSPQTPQPEDKTSAVKVVLELRVLIKHCTKNTKRCLSFRLVMTMVLMMVLKIKMLLMMRIVMVMVMASYSRKDA